LLAFDVNFFHTKKGIKTARFLESKPMLRIYTLRYLEEILPNLTAEENIHRLCFEKSGVLFTEFDNIFTDLFNGRYEKYRSIIKCLAEEHGTLENIAERLGRVKGGDLLEALYDMEESGFLSRDFTWHIEDAQRSKISQYRIRDNYIRFYLKYIEPKKQTIQKGLYKGMPPSWFSILGYQFENLVLNNLTKIVTLLQIPPQEIVTAGPYLQTENLQRQKCQIDLMIQTKFHQLYLCEVKFSRSEMTNAVIAEIKEKIQRLDTPRMFSIRPVLVHINGVADSVQEAEFFSRIIDFSELLT
jgi:uncharacterized protein